MSNLTVSPVLIPASAQTLIRQHITPTYSKRRDMGSIRLLVYSQLLLDNWAGSSYLHTYSVPRNFIQGNLCAVNNEERLVRMLRLTKALPAHDIIRAF